MKTKHLLAALLIGGSVFTYGQTTFSVSVNTSLDDHEEHINGSVQQTQTLGSMDPGSSDLELGNEKPAADPQLVGVRFTSLSIPAGATILNAYIQFVVDDIAKNTDPCILNVQVEDNVNPATFSDNPFSLSTRTVMPSMVTWTVSGNTWSVVGSGGADQRTPDLKTLVQAVVNKAGWASGNAMAFYIKGYGTREVESFDGDAPKAPMLVVQYSNVATSLTEQIQNTSFVNVFPNPFQGTFNMNIEVHKASDLNIELYDMTGKLIETKNVSEAGVGTYHYAPSLSLNAGLYFVKVQAGAQHQTLKVIAE